MNLLTKTEKSSLYSQIVVYIACIIIPVILFTSIPLLASAFQDTENPTNIMILYFSHVTLIIILEHIIIYCYKKLLKKDSNYKIERLENRIIKLEEEINNIKNNKKQPLNHDKSNVQSKLNIDHSKHDYLD